MKKIVLITSLYPSDDIKFKNNTTVCHYFAKEWVKMGYNVRVFFLYNEYPQFYYPILKLFSSSFAEYVPAAILEKKTGKEHSFVLEGIKITRLPAYKSKPHGNHSENVIRSITDRIHSILMEEEFIPNYILGHFLRPGIWIVSALKKIYPSATTTISIHGKVIKYLPKVNEELSNISYLGYRSYPIKKYFETIYGVRPYFMCMSGVPSEYIREEKKSFSNGVHSFIYVGNFMHRKFPHSLVPAITSNYKNEDFIVTFVGDGRGINKIKKEIKKAGVEKNVIFTGRIERSEVTKEMDEADVFIMISEKETFGLVYLEAMARGCITVASRDEGMDGVILDGVNGFLCKAGDVGELSNIIAKIKAMDKEALEVMSQKAIETARKMTDVKMAEEYIKGISNN